MKDKLLKAKLLSKYKSDMPTTTIQADTGGIPTAMSAQFGEIPQAKTVPIGDIPQAKTVQIGEIPQAKTVTPSELLRTIKAKDSGYVPGIKTHTIEPQPVLKSYSPVKDYLKKGKSK